MALLRKVRGLISLTTSASLSMQAGGSKSTLTQLLEKRPRIVVDKNRGLYLLLTGHPEAYSDQWG